MLASLSAALTAVAVIGAATPAQPAPVPAAPASPPGVESGGPAVAAHLIAYLDGLDALETGRWADAVASFNKAVDAAENDDHTLIRARGVAHLLAERHADAVRDLKRALQLKAGDKEARAWLGLAYRMAGDFSLGASTSPEASNDSYETFLGQLGRDYGDLIFRRAQLAREPPSEYKDSAVEALNKSDAPPRHREAKVRLPQAGAWYSSRMKSVPEMGAVLFARAKTRYEAPGPATPRKRTSAGPRSTGNSPKRGWPRPRRCSSGPRSCVRRTRRGSSTWASGRSAAATCPGRARPWRPPCGCGRTSPRPATRWRGSTPTSG
jgi:hypothetical protein